MTEPDAGRLRAAMAAVAAERTDATMRELFAALIEARVLVPLRSQSDEGMDVAVVETEDGPLFAGFTSLDALNASVPGALSTVASARALARLALAEEGGALLIDPGQPDGGRLGRRDLQWIADGLVPTGEDSARSSGSLRLFSLSGELPEGLEAAVSAAAADGPAIRAVHAFEGAFDEGARHLMLGVELDPELDPDARAAAIAPVTAAAQEVLDAGAYLDVVSLTPPMVEVARAAGRALYPRS